MTLKNKKTKGFLYYAHNNEDINYLRLAICSALTGRYQIPSFRAMVVTDDYSYKVLEKKDKLLLNELFDEIKIDNDFETENTRVAMTHDNLRKTYSWYNGTRSNAYTDSIYDETIMVDVDFLFQDNKLDNLWGSNIPIMMNKSIIPILNKQGSEKYGFPTTETIGNFTIPMYWATVVYFNREDTAKDFFYIVNHIKNNYFYYQRLYQVEDNSYRNDYSFSIALYMINGFATPGPEWEIPYKFVLSRTQDSIYRIDKGQIKIIIRTGYQREIDQIVNIEKISLHCMNKEGLQGNYDNIIRTYTDD